MDKLIKYMDGLVDLPFEVGKTYTTKMQTGEKFTVHKIDTNKSTGNISLLWGVYENSPHLLNCPIYPERLIPYQEKVQAEVEHCQSCGREIKLSDEKAAKIYDICNTIHFSYEQVKQKLTDIINSDLIK